VTPHTGGLRLQAVRPAGITKLYRDLVTSGGREGKGLSARTVAHVHAVLRKAFGDAVRIDQLLPSNPVECAKRSRMQRSESGKVCDGAQLRTFLDVTKTHRLSAFFHLAAYTGARVPGLGPPT
jgi:integrase